MWIWQRPPGFCNVTMVLCICSVSISIPVQADTIHEFRDHRGRVMFTDRPATGKGMHYSGVWVSWKGWVRRAGYDPGSYHENKQRFTPAIATVANRHGVSRALLHAVIEAESAYDPNAVSRAGAVGLMQLMPMTAKRFGVYDRHNPEQNLNGGTRYLRYLLELFKGDLELAVAAYNAGENAVMHYNQQVPPYRETRKYLQQVLRQFRQLRQQYPESLYN